MSVSYFHHYRMHFKAIIYDINKQEIDSRAFAIWKDAADWINTYGLVKRWSAIEHVRGPVVETQAQNTGLKPPRPLP